MSRCSLFTRSLFASRGDIAFDLTLAAKLVVVALSGLSAFMHSRSGSRLGLAFFGAVSALSAVFALFLGVLLSRG